MRFRAPCQGEPALTDEDVLVARVEELEEFMDDLDAALAAVRASRWRRAEEETDAAPSA